MTSAFVLALRQLADPAVLRILAKCVAITVAVFAALATVAWWGIGLALADIKDGYFPAETMRVIIAVIVGLFGGWLLWRVVALAVLQFFASDVVLIVERRHYPQALASARTVALKEELVIGSRGVLRALGYNLLALPIALLAGVPLAGIGTALVFLTVNAVLLGRELTEMVWLRHRHDASARLPLGQGERFFLGAAVAGLFTVPFANLLAPVLGAAMATHLVHRKGTFAHAP